MSISPKCKPIAGEGLMAYLAIDDALEAIHEENYKEAYGFSGNAIGHFYIMFSRGVISGEELKKATEPLIEAKRALDEGDKDKMFDKILSSLDETREFIFQKVVACECGKKE